MNTVHQIKKMATMLGRVMAKSGSDIQITVSGQQAYRRPGQINLPMGDFSDPDVITMTHGFIDHEIGHERHTEHSCFVAAANQSNILKHMLNILEDVRMECCVGDEYPGAKRNLANLVELAMKRGLFSEPSDKANSIQMIQAFCLYHGRFAVTGQTVLADYAQKAESILIDMIGSDLVQKIKAEVESTRLAKSTNDAYQIAQRIINLIQDEIDKQQQQQQQQQAGSSSDDSDQDSDEQDSSQNGQSSSDEQDEDNSESGSGSSNDSEDDDSDAGNSSQSDSDSDDSDDDSNADDSSQGDSDSDDDGQGGDLDDSSDCDSSSDSSQNSNSDKAMLDALKEILGATDNDGLDDYHSAIAEMLEKEAQESQADGLLDVLAGVSPLPFLKADLYGDVINQSEAKSVGKSVYHKMNRVLIDKAPTADLYRTTGRKLSSRRLAGVASGNNRIFVRKQEQADISAAISFLIDASGSMLHCMSLANDVAFSLCHGLSQSGIATELGYFSARNPMTPHSCYLAKEFDRPLIAKNFQVQQSGYTPSGEAMMSMLLRLAVRSETNKMLFVVTDGDADNPDAVKASLNLARELGIKVVPIGLFTHRVEGFSRDDFMTVNALSDLPQAVDHAIKAKLFA
jgi:cobalamin biosynthesis protein CobT